MLTERDLDTRANQGHDGVDDSSPTSGLSGSTLNNDSPPSEHHEDNWILRTAQDHSLQPHQQHHHLSPTVYYDDLHHEDSGDDQARLIEAAEEEEVSPRMENRELSPTVFYEPSIPPSDSATSVCCRVSRGSAHGMATDSKRLLCTHRCRLCSILPTYQYRPMAGLDVPKPQLDFITPWFQVP